jgi:hypothetical protein
MPTPPTPVDSLPAAPSPSSPSTFEVLADAYLAALPTFRTELNNLGSNVYDNAVEAANSASNSAATASASANSAASAGLAANVSEWVSGTTYSAGDNRWSPVDYLTYRRKTNGGGTTDPSADPTNWALLSSSFPVWVTKSANYTAVSRDFILVDTSSAAVTITLPAAPSQNQTVRVKDYANTWATHPVTIARNGSKIEGLSEDMTCSTNHADLTFTYVDATEGWKI